ncbi:MAG: serpin family protein [Bacteroidetes bacterium]|nr:serpin family protein [Bacteroidota bacterium]
MKRIYPLFAFLFTIIVLIACRKDNGIKPGPGKDLKLSAAELQEASADNTFSFDLFRSVAANNTNGNLFISPLSVSMALGMTTNGANGSTLDSMRNVLHFKGFSQDQVNTYYSDLLTQLPELDPNTTLKIANSVWYRNTFSVLPQFLQTENKSYGAKIQALDFSNPSSVTTINDWVSQQTNGKIPKIVSQIGGDDIMFLINAVYFKSIWANKFDPKNTTSMAFTRADNSQVQASFMRGEMNCNLYRGNDATLLELPYSGNKYSMVIVLPATGKTVNNIMAELDSANWQNWMSHLSAAKYEISVPKFQFSYGAELKNSLGAMGMGIAFSDAADFSNINPGGGLQITSVQHKAYVGVDEAGTTAAAATSVTIGLTAAPVFDVTVNHPFIFMIREMKSGLVLFTGIVNDPTQNGL